MLRIDTIKLMSDISFLAINASLRSVVTDNYIRAWEGLGCPLSFYIGIKALSISKLIKNVKVIIYQDYVPNFDQKL